MFSVYCRLSFVTCGSLPWGVTVGEAGFDISVFCPTYLCSDKVALVMVTADAFNGMNDPIAAITTRIMMVNAVPNCMSFMRIERISEIICFYQEF